MPTNTVQLPRSLSSAPFTAQQALAAGLSRWELRRLGAQGDVCRVLNGVYRPSHLQDSTELRCAAAGLVLPAHAVAADRTASWLWGIDAYSWDELATVPPLEVFVFRGHKRIGRREAGGGERDLRTDDVTTLHGLRLTTALRTSLDLACRLPAYEAMATMDAFARHHAVTAEKLATLLPRYRRRRGVVQARRLVPLVDGRSESTGESFTKLAIVDYGLPLPQPQFWVVHDGRPLFRLDLCYPERKIAIEYDGEEHHTSEVDRERDRRRRRWLREQGWIVIVVTKDSFSGRSLEQWLHELRWALLARAA